MDEEDIQPDPEELHPDGPVPDEIREDTPPVEELPESIPSDTHSQLDELLQETLDGVMAARDAMSDPELPPVADQPLVDSVGLNAPTSESPFDDSLPREPADAEVVGGIPPTLEEYLREHDGKIPDEVSSFANTDSPFIPNMDGGAFASNTFADTDRSTDRASAEAEYRAADMQRWNSLLGHLSLLTEMCREHTRRIDELTDSLEKERL